MGIEEFDISKIKEVNIDSVRPNTWNPKEYNKTIIEYLKNSIDQMGFKQPLSVRQNNGYEILDGEQRWTAMRELGAKTIYIYDNGIVSDEDAKSETINWQIQVPFDPVKLAPIVLELAELNFTVPYSQKEILDFKELLGLNLDSRNEDKSQNGENETKTLSVKMSNEAYYIVEQAIAKCREIDPDNISEARAIELICAEYLGGQCQEVN